MITYNKLRKDITVGMEDVRVKTYTVMGFTFFTVLVLAAFAIRPVLFTLSSEIGLLDTLRTQDDKLKIDVSNLAQAEQVYNNKVEGNTDVLDVALPNSQETGPLFANVQAMASNDKIQITSTRFIRTTLDAQSLQIPEGYVPVRPGIAPLYFTLTGNANPNDLAVFLKDVTAFPRTFNIVQTSLASSTDKNGKVTSTTFTLTGFVFYAVQGS